MLFCSIYDRSRLASVAALVRSLREHHPDAEVELLYVADASPAPVEDVQPLALSALGPEAAMLVPGTPVEQRDGVLLAPLLRRLLQQSETVVFLGSAMRVTAPLDPLLEALDDGADVVAVEMVEGRLPEDGLSPDAETVEAYGHLNRRVLGVRRSATVDALLDHWPTWSEGDPGVLPFEMASGAVQRHLDRGVAIAGSQARILPPRGLGLGYWNLPLAGDDVVRLVDTTGLDPRSHDGPFPHETRLRLSHDAGMSELIARFEEEALARPTSMPPDYGVDPVGRPLGALMRRLVRAAIHEERLTAWLWSDTGARQWEAWLGAPADVGAERGITRLQHEIHRSREDLRHAFANLEGPDGELYLGWLSTHGIAELGLLDSDVPATTTLSDVAPARLPWGVNVAGFFRSELGLGEAARLLIAALDGAKVPALPIQGRFVPPTRQDAEFTFTTPAEAPYPINVVCLNGDLVPSFAREADGVLFRDRHSIALWWWEIVGAFPGAWQPAFDHLDEIWVASQHIYDAIAPHSPVPVNRVRMPVVVPRLRPFTREQLGLPAEGFLFTFVFDYHSTAARKNPVGHIDAFKRAFGEGSGAKLVIKCINAERMPSQHEQTLRAIGDHPDITVIDRFVSADEKNALIAGCDCYLSLHRSEGFGLTPAEAMAFGKPVIATRYGGVLDFMDDTTSYLVDWTPTEVGPGAHPYPPDAIWAEPDLDQAARLMRHVFENPEDAGEKGRRAAAYIAERHSPAATGALMRRRLEAVYEDISGRVAPWAPAPLPAPTTHEDITSLAALPRPDGRAAGVKGPVRDAVERALSPFADRQLVVDRRLLDEIAVLRDAIARSVVDTGARIDHAIREERAQTLAALRRLRAAIEEQDRGLAEVAHGLAEAVGRVEPSLEHHLAEHRATPYMAEPWERFEVEGVGEVEGYRDLAASGDEAYRAFEERFRGPRERILELQRPYVPLLAGCAPLLDIGCGRGELLELLRDAGVEAAGVDLDEGMLAEARERGLDATLGDGIARLEESDPGSLGAVTAMQVIEHLPEVELTRMLSAARRALRDDGRLVVETVNPHVVHAMKMFWLDLSHQQPLFPDVVLTLCQAAGFPSAFVMYPGGTGTPEIDRHRVPAYAVVAEAG